MRVFKVLILAMALFLGSACTKDKSQPGNYTPPKDSTAAGEFLFVGDKKAAIESLKAIGIKDAKNLPHS